MKKILFISFSSLNKTSVKYSSEFIFGDKMTVMSDTEEVGKKFERSFLEG